VRFVGGVCECSHALSLLAFGFCSACIRSWDRCMYWIAHGVSLEAVGSRCMCSGGQDVARATYVWCVMLCDIPMECET